MLWGARRTFTVDLELKTPIADPEAPECLLSVRREPAEPAIFFRFGSAYSGIGPTGQYRYSGIRPTG